MGHFTVYAHCCLFCYLYLVATGFIGSQGAKEGIGQGVMSLGRYPVCLVHFLVALWSTSGIGLLSEVQLLDIVIMSSPAGSGPAGAPGRSPGNITLCGYTPAPSPVLPPGHSHSLALLASLSKTVLSSGHPWKQILALFPPVNLN